MVEQCVEHVLCDFVRVADRANVECVDGTLIVEHLQVAGDPGVHTLPAFRLLCCFGIAVFFVHPVGYFNNACSRRA